MNIDAYGIHLGPLYFRFYGIIIVVGVLAAMYLSYRRANLRGLAKELVLDMVVWLLIGGIIGARLWHIFTPPQSMIDAGITTRFYLTHPLDALAIWKGGLGLPGAVIGGALALWIYARQKKQSFLSWADTIAPGLAVAQAIGRWGNFVNQEVYGMPSNLPWAIFINEYNRVDGFREFATYHPLFLYECLWNLAIAFALTRIDKHWHQRLKKGDLFLLYLCAYPFGRFWLEFLRLDPSPLGSLNINQLVMALIFLCSLTILFFRHFKKSPARVKA